MNNLIVVKIDPAGQVEVFALNPAPLQVVVLDQTKPATLIQVKLPDGSWLPHYQGSDQPVQYESKQQARYKARKNGWPAGYELVEVPGNRVSIELPQVLTRLDQADLESIQKVLKG